MNKIQLNNRIINTLFLVQDKQKELSIIKELELMGLHLMFPIDANSLKEYTINSFIELLSKNTINIASLHIVFVDLDLFPKNQHFTFMIQLARFIEEKSSKLLILFTTDLSFFALEPLKEFIYFKKWNNIYDFLLTPIESNSFFLKINGYLQYLFIIKEQTDIIKKMEDDNKILHKYFSEDIITEILHKTGNQMKDSVIRRATILFLDIRDFTSISETIKPDQVVELLDLLFTDIVDLIFSHNGSVNKFIGDAILATFGCPKSFKNDAENAFFCAMQLLSSIKIFNQVKPSFIKKDIEIGIGIATGDVFAGNVGSYRKMEYTVIGDTVNLASRLQDMTKQVNSNLVIDLATKQKITQSIDFQTKNVTIKGKIDNMNIYYLTKDSI